MDYKIELKKTVTTQGEKWVAICPALQFVRGGGDTPEEALEILQIEMENMLEFLKDEGEPIPEPDAYTKFENYSGRITYRPGKRLHHDIAIEAQKQDISLNSYINNAVSFYQGNSYHLTQYKELDDKVNKLIRDVETSKIHLSSLTNVITTKAKPKSFIQVDSKYANFRN